MSRFAVASSRTRIRLFPRSARVKHKSYFYPTESADDEFVMTVSNFYSIARIVSSNPVVRSAFVIASSEYNPIGSMFFRIVPENTKLVYGIILMLDRSVFSPIEFTSTPFTAIMPPVFVSIGTMRNNA